MDESDFKIFKQEGLKTNEINKIEKFRSPAERKNVGSGLVNNSKDVYINNKWYREIGEPKLWYEILIFKSISGGEWILDTNGKYKNSSFSYEYYLPNMIKFLNDKKIIIHAVKRLLDGAVFTVGTLDEKCRKISMITIENNKDIILNFLNSTYCCFLENAELIKRSILLITEDGISITDPHQLLWAVDKKFLRYKKLNAQNCRQENDICFSSREARMKYILHNKPVSISLQNLLNKISFNHQLSPAAIDTITAIFQQKIGN